MNPYLAGTLLGIVLLAAMFLSGRGLGASGGLKYCAVSIVGALDRPHAEGSVYYSKYFENGKKPLNNWLTFEILGVVAGGFISGAISKRLKLKIEKSKIRRDLNLGRLGVVRALYPLDHDAPLVFMFIVIILHI